MIPTEDNYVEWFTCAARFFFIREGYAFLSFSLGQVGEKGFPVDKLLLAGNKLVGLQFKGPIETPATRGGLEYEADSTQHHQMSKAEGNWLFYALPQSADPLDQLLTHQKMLFAQASQVEFTLAQRFVPKEAKSFKELVECIEDRSCGLQLPEGYSAEEFLAVTRENPMTMYLVIGHSERLAFALKALSFGDGVE